MSIQGEWLSEGELRKRAEEVARLVVKRAEELPNKPETEDYDALREFALQELSKRGLEPDHNMGVDLFLGVHGLPPRSIKLWVTQVHTVPPTVAVLSSIG